MWLEGVPVDHVDRSVKQAGDELLQANILVDRAFRAGLEFHQDIDIAVGTVVTARDRTKQRGMGNALRPQVSLTLPELRYDLVAFHNVIIAQNP